ncbi:MAG: DUF4399 domain-containing protein [Acidimicrobiia bacterium]
MGRRTLTLALAAVMILAACGDDDDDGGASGSGGDGDTAVEITSPADGDEVPSPVTVEMDATNFTIEPAGDGAVNEGAGHFHLMVDTECVAEGEVIPSDDTHKHFGTGATEAELELDPGEHTICLQAGDGAHTALDLTDEITITVT